MKKRNLVLLLILSLIFVGCSTTTNTTKDEEKEKTEILVVDTVPNRNSFESVKTGDDEKETVVEEEKEENTDTTNTSTSNNTGSSSSDSGSSSNTGNSGNSGSSNSGNSGNTKTCTKTVHHDAVTHVEHHDAVVIHHDAETHEVYHEGAGYSINTAYFIDGTTMTSGKCYNLDDYNAFCAICDEYKYSHKNENGDWIGYSTQSYDGHDEGYTETVVDKEAWDEVVQEAYDETVVDQAAWDEVVSYEC